MKTKYLFITAGILVSAATTASATIIGFGNLGGNNTAIPSDLGSSAIADGNGFVVSNGATPDITLTWQDNWDIYASNLFAPIEDLTVGGGDWDNEGDIPRVAQLEHADHFILFNTNPGAAVQINSFDFGLTAENPGDMIAEYTLSLSGFGVGEVWSQIVSVDNTDGADVMKISPIYTPVLGEVYTLSFKRTASTGTGNPDGRLAIDNLSFNQVIPEPSSMSLFGFSALALLARRRR